MLVCSRHITRPPEPHSAHSPASRFLQAIYKAAKTRRAMQDSAARKLANRIKHSAPGSIKVKADRKKKLVAEVE
jgi:WD repeat and SOF domain-containing protein 1